MRSSLRKLILPLTLATASCVPAARPSIPTTIPDVFVRDAFSTTTSITLPSLEEVLEVPDSVKPRFDAYIRATTPYHVQNISRPDATQGPSIPGQKLSVDSLETLILTKPDNTRIPIELVKKEYERGIALFTGKAQTSLGVTLSGNHRVIIDRDSILKVVQTHQGSRNYQKFLQKVVDGGYVALQLHGAVYVLPFATQSNILQTAFHEVVHIAQEKLDALFPTTQIQPYESMWKEGIARYLEQRNIILDQDSTLTESMLHERFLATLATLPVQPMENGTLLVPFSDLTFCDILRYDIYPVYASQLVSTYADNTGHSQVTDAQLQAPLRDFARFPPRTAAVSARCN